jgi:hypothetical protein
VFFQVGRLKWPRNGINLVEHNGGWADFMGTNLLGRSILQGGVLQKHSIPIGYDNFAERLAAQVKRVFDATPRRTP